MSIRFQALLWKSALYIKWETLVDDEQVGVLRLEYNVKYSI